MVGDGSFALDKVADCDSVKLIQLIKKSQFYQKNRPKIHMLILGLILGYLVSDSNVSHNPNPLNLLPRVVPKMLDFPFLHLVLISKCSISYCLCLPFDL